MNKIRKRTRARECALQILYQHEMNPAPLESIIERFWKEEAVLPEDEVRSFAEKIVSGTVEHLGEIDGVISKAVENWEITRMAVIDRNILRSSTYEILFLSEIPPKVAINEGVNLAKKFSQIESGKFVNGILDKIAHTEKPRYESSPKGPLGEPAG